MINRYEVCVNNNTRAAIFKGLWRFNDMKPDQLYQELIDLAERMQITVSEQNLKVSGIKVRSGLCTVKGQKLFVMDKHKSVHKKIELLAAELAIIPLEDMYIIPAVRELLEKYTENKKD